MPKQIDYSQQLSEIDVSGTDAIRRAGALRGVAAETEGKANAQMIGFLGTTAIEAYKGKLLAEENNKIYDIAQRTEWAAQQDIAANNLKIGGQMLDSMGSDDFMGDQTLSYFKEEASKFAQARQQGLIGRDEAVARIGAVVKEYSARMPGWASDFRKLAADMTGIDRVDTAGFHHWLTTQSQQEKLALKAAEFELQQRGKVAEWKGYQSLSQVTPRDIADWQLKHAFDNQHAATKQELESKKWMQEQADEKINKMVSSDIVNATTGVYGALEKMGALNLNANSPDAIAFAQKNSAQLVLTLDQQRQALIAKVQAYAGIGINGNRLSAAEAEKRVKEINTYFDKTIEGVKTADGFIAFTQTMKNTENMAGFLKNQASLLNPMMDLIAKTGIGAPLMQMYLQDPVIFEKKFPQLGGAFKSAFKNVDALAHQFAGVANGSLSLADKGNGITPANRVVIANSIQDVLTQTFTGNKQVDMKDVKASTTFANMMKSWFEVFDPSNPAHLERFGQMMTTDTRRVEAVLKEMPPAQRAIAFEPLLRKMDTTIPSTIATVRTQLEDLNKLASGYSIELDPYSGRMKLSPRPAPQMETVSDPGGAVRMRMNAPPISGEEREKMAAINNSLKWLNASALVLGAVVAPFGFTTNDQLGKDVGTTEGVAARIYSAIQGNAYDNVVAPFKKKGMELYKKAEGVPKNQPQSGAVVDDKTLDALAYAESGGNDNAVGDGGKAVSKYQMWEGAMKDVGMTAEDRKDPAKAKEAARRYFQMQLDEQGGDRQKALAAWNMGPTAFKKHMEKYGDAWLLELPDATRGLIRRFNRRYAAS